jgi:hypothetical protein
MPKTDTEITIPPSLKALWAVIVALVSALVWVGTTAWNASGQLQAQKAAILEQAGKDADAKFMSREAFLTWRIEHSREETARDREITERLERLAQRLGASR